MDGIQWKYTYRNPWQVQAEAVDSAGPSTEPM